MTNKNIAECVDCGGTVSRLADKCPHCGRPFGEAPAKTKLSSIIIAGVVGLFILAGIVKSNDATQKENARRAALSPADRAAEDEAKRLESVRADAVYVARRALKASLRDPDSLELGSVRANRDGTLVCMEYRARNGFGGLNKEILVVRSGTASQELRDWNKHCTSGTLYTMR